MTSKTVAALTAEITANFPDNTTGLITPALLRGVSQDIVDSYPNSNTANAIANAQLAQMPGRTLKGNGTTGTGNAADLTQFTMGVGTYAATANYAGGITNTTELAISGSVPAPTTSADAVLIVQKNSAVTGLGGTSNPNPAGYFSLTKNTNGADRGVALFAEAQDFAGSAAGFIEGIRTHAVLAGGALGEAFAIEATASAVGFTYTTLVAVESNCFNSSGISAPAVFNGTAPPTLAVGVMTENDGANFADAGFLVNPFSIGKFRRGFVVGNNSVDQVAFASYAATVIGLDLSVGTQTNPILLGNTKSIFWNNSGGTPIDTLRVDASNILQVGTATATANVPVISNATTNITVTAGAVKSDIAITTSRVKVNAFTAGAGAFSIGGFKMGAANVDGEKIYLYNDQAQQMTIVNEDGVSTAANRIQTLTGGNVVLRAGRSFATFSYDLNNGAVTGPRWVLESTN